MKIEIISEAIKRYAGAIIGEKGLRISEVCDFGDIYGFLFETKNIYDNVYWCVNKRTYEITVFSPTTDIKMYIGRKTISTAGGD